MDTWTKQKKVHSFTRAFHLSRSNSEPGVRKSRDVFTWNSSCRIGLSMRILEIDERCLLYHGTTSHKWKSLIRLKIALKCTLFPLLCDVVFFFILCVGALPCDKADSFCHPHFSPPLFKSIINFLYTWVWWSGCMKFYLDFIHCLSFSHAVKLRNSLLQTSETFRCKCRCIA